MCREHGNHGDFKTISRRDPHVDPYFESQIEPATEDRAPMCKIGENYYPNFTPNSWHGDTAASCSIDNDDSGMFDVEVIDETIGLVGGHRIRATKKGKKKVAFRQADGKLVERIIAPVKYCATAQERLLSITNEMSSQDAVLSSNDKNDIILSYPNGDTIAFDRREKTGDGWIAGIDAIPNRQEIASLATGG